MVFYLKNIKNMYVLLHKNYVEKTELKFKILYMLKMWIIQGQRHKYSTDKYEYKILKCSLR